MYNLSKHKIVRAVLFPCALICVVSGFHEVSLAQVEPAYPRLANMYTHGSVDPSKMDELARWDLLILNSVWQQNELAQLRALNPGIKLYMYVCPYCIEAPPTVPDPWQQQNYDYAQDHNLWWYNSSGSIASDWPGSQMINLTDLGVSGPEGNWRAYIAKRIGDLMQERPALDGVFLDNYWKRLSWNLWLDLDSDCNPEHNPVGCDGVADAAADLDTLWNRALWDLARDIRSRFDALEEARTRPLAVLSNRASDYFSQLNGTFYEFFPSGWNSVDPGNPYNYNWNIEMTGEPEGYLMAPFNNDPYNISVINADWTGTDSAPDRSAEFERHKRFTLVSSLFGDGYYSLDAGEQTGHGALWWEPEYDHDGRGQGYLGFPTNSMYRVDLPTGSELLKNGSFTDSSTDWQVLATQAIGSFDIDTTTFQSAPFSARVEMTSKSASYGTIKLYQAPIAIQADEAYTLRFRAKANPPATMMVHLYGETCPSNRCLTDKFLGISSEWEEYVISFTSAGFDDEAGLNIFVLDPGVIWFDDISLRYGDTSVYRRDFENGTVLLNYTSDPVNVDLEGDYERLSIAGSAEFDGRSLQQETIPPWDARILLGPQSSQGPPSDGGGGDEPTSPAKAQVLKQNEPNPFNPTTRIGFRLSQREFVRLSVFDVAGRLVRTLVNRSMDGGIDHSVVWDGRDRFGKPATSGIYFYQVQTPSFEKTRKMTLLQ